MIRVAAAAAVLAAAGSVTAFAAAPPGRGRPPGGGTTTPPPATTAPTQSTPTQSTPTQSTPTCPLSNPPNELRLAGGSPQTGQIGKAFLTDLRVALANTNGCAVTTAVGGVAVTFSAPGSGPSGTFAGSGSNTVTVGTDATGVAVAPPFTANETTGGYTVTATSDYGSVSFSLTNTASGVVASVTATGGGGQSAFVNSRYAQPLQAQVVDANGSPVQGVSVSFSLGTGPYGAGATFLGGTAQATALTNASGVATSPPFVANATPGRFTATAATSGVSGVASYDLDNHAAANTIATTQAAQSATVGSRFREPLQARVLDPSGQPLEGVTVTFSLATGTGGAGATFLGGAAQATALSDEDGRASSPAFVANATAGTFTAIASAAGTVASADYALRNLGARLLAVTARRAAPVGERYTRPLEARVLDAQGRPVEGVAVTFAIGKSAGGATAAFPDGSGQATATSDSSGRVTSPPVEANTTAGSFTASAAIGTGSARVAYRLRNVPARPANITAGAASSETTAVGTRFPIRLAVTVEDENGNPIEGARVAFVAPARGPSGRFGSRGRVATARTNAKGIALAPPLVANREAGGYAVTAHLRGARLRAAFALVNTPA